MYVGITGQDSDANLYRRYAQYLVDQRDQNGRPAVTYMLSNWDGDLFFNYVSLPNKKVDLHKMEKALLNAVRPPVNKRDLDATISAPRAAIFDERYNCTSCSARQLRGLDILFMSYFHS